MAILQPCIVIAEDEFLIRLTAATELSDAGFDVLEAENTDEVLTILNAQAATIQLLFTDIHMPGNMDGLALAHRVRHLWPHIALIVASGDARPGTAELPAGSCFLAKPYQSSHLAIQARAMIGA